MAFFFLLFLCACSPKQSQQHQASSSSTIFSNHSLHRSLLEDAKQFDALVPVGFRCIKKQVPSAQNNPLHTVRYEGMQPLDKVVSFYKRELEAAGWDLSNFSSNQEGLFFCRKGGQECAITIQVQGKTIITFVYRTTPRLLEHQCNDTLRINQPLR